MTTPEWTMGLEKISPEELARYRCNELRRQLAEIGK
jgi:hypothetical protein